MIRHPLWLAAAAALVAACAPTASEAPTNDPSDTGTAVPVASAAPPAAAAIAPLGPAATAALPGELRCGFEAAGALLFSAAADVGRNAPIAAAVMLDGRPVALRGERGGGFDQLRRGGSFGGAGVRAAIVLQTARPTGDEGSVHDALLTVTPTGEQPRLARGRWRCGP